VLLNADCRNIFVPKFVNYIEPEMLELFEHVGYQVSFSTHSAYHFQQHVSTATVRTQKYYSKHPCKCFAMLRRL